MGYRCDLLIRQHGSTNKINMEYCASEVEMKSKKLERKEIRENFFKLPKLLKRHAWYFNRTKELRKHKR